MGVTVLISVQPFVRHPNRLQLVCGRGGQRAVEIGRCVQRGSVRRPSHTVVTEVGRTDDGRSLSWSARERGHAASDHLPCISEMARLTTFGTSITSGVSLLRESLPGRRGRFCTMRNGMGMVCFTARTGRTRFDRSKAGVDLHTQCSRSPRTPRRKLTTLLSQTSGSTAVSSSSDASSSVINTEEDEADSVASSVAADVDIAVIGGGLAGLCCALHLSRRGVKVLLLEADDEIGGRVRTDHVDGFLLDRGFQIFLTAYPESRSVLEYDKLRLRKFYAGALVRFDSAFHRVADPFRHPFDAIPTLGPDHPIGSWLDKLRIGILRLRTVATSVEDILLSSSETTTVESLRRDGFSSSIIDRFFRPFFGGIFFDRELFTSSRMLEFVMKMLAQGDNTVPAEGIGAIAQQIASRLPAGTIRRSARVHQIRDLKMEQKHNDMEGGGEMRRAKELELVGGAMVRARKGVVVATEGPEACRLLGDKLMNTSASSINAPRGTVCLYFALDHPPPSPGNEPVLFLNGTEKGLVNNMCFISRVAPEYAPKGKDLASVSLVGSYPDWTDSELESAVREELGEWFGAGEVATWSHLRTYRIPYAQPDQQPPWIAARSVRLGDGWYVCGDHRSTASFNGAMVSGRVVAEAIVDDFNTSHNP